MTSRSLKPISRARIKESTKSVPLAQAKPKYPLRTHLGPYLRRLNGWLYRLALTILAPTQKTLAHVLVSQIAGLELMRGECRQLPPVLGSFGPFTLTGNSNPEITYLVFDDALMEFVSMTVHISLPDRITFHAKTEDLGDVFVKPPYKRPFYFMAHHVFRYFPLRADEKRNLCPTTSTK